MVWHWWCCDLLVQILSFRSTSVHQVIDHCLSKNETLNSLTCFTGVCSWTASFTLCTGPLSCVIANQSVPHHLYADGTWLYISFSADNSESSFYHLQQCLISVRDSMTTNKLKLNPSKTELLLIGREHQRIKYLFTFPVTLLGNETHPSKLLKILVLCLTRSSISGLTPTTFANFLTVISVTCTESENI